MRKKNCSGLQCTRKQTESIFTSFTWLEGKGQVYLLVSWWRVSINLSIKLEKKKRAVILKKCMGGGMFLYVTENCAQTRSECSANVIVGGKDEDSNGDFSLHREKWTLAAPARHQRNLFEKTYLWLGARRWWTPGRACSPPRTGTCRCPLGSGCWLSALRYSPEACPVEETQHRRDHTWVATLRVRPTWHYTANSFRQGDQSAEANLGFGCG